MCFYKRIYESFDEFNIPLQLDIEGTLTFKDQKEVLL